MGVIKRMKLNVIHEFPEELLHVDVKDVHNVLGGPTLIHLKGKRDEALFVSTLLHANEITSFLVLQKLINELKGKELYRDLIIFIGNTYAAAEGMRHLPGQADFNRIWEPVDTPEKKMAMDVMTYAKEQNLFASIDIHNNSGKNPFYACINVVDPKFLDLAANFGDHIVYFTKPHNVQSMAFSKICPSTTIEAGLPGDPRGIQQAFEFVLKVFNSATIPKGTRQDSGDLYHTIARIKVSEKARVDFDDNKNSDSDFSFVSNIDSRNFQIIPKGSHMGYGKDIRLLRVVDNMGVDITDDFIELKGDEVLTKRLFIPSMFTKDTYIMKEDCLGYIMETITPNF